MTTVTDANAPTFPVPPVASPDTTALIADLLRYWQRELRDPTSGGDGRDALTKLQITEPAVVDHFGLGYVSGRALEALSEDQYRSLCHIKLAKKRRFMLQDCVVMPVHDERGELVDLCGLRPWQSGLRFVHWQSQHRGLIGVQSITAAGGDGSVILCDNPFHALHARQHGYTHVIAIRSVDELPGHMDLLERHGVRRVYLVSRQQRQAIVPMLEQKGIEVVVVRTPAKDVVIQRECYEEVLRSQPVVTPAATPQAHPATITTATATADDATSGGVTLIERTDTRLVFRGHPGVTYRIDATAATGLTMRVQLRAELEGRSTATFIDRLDLGSDASRRKLARACASRLALSSLEVEDHLTAIAQQVDAMVYDALESRSQDTRPQPRKLTDDDRTDALAILTTQDVLAHLASVMERCCSFVGEDANKRLALLVAASRLLPQPLGSMIRGPAGCGKSALMQAVVKTLSPQDVLYFSRLTAQALYFLPKDDLQHKLLVCDEYEGLEDSEYALRTLMSSQTLSLAITLREGGRVPVTRTVETPAQLAVMVSTTGEVNIENLSRFIEVGMNASPDQTQRVMRSLARSNGVNHGADLQRAQDMNQLLRPCSVVIPFADRLTYSAHTVLARRRFAQVVGLVSAHAALHQHQRRSIGHCNNGDGLAIEATKADYEAVYPLLPFIIDHVEESVSPPAMRLLERVERDGFASGGRLTRQDVMERMNWSYSTAYRVLRELVALDLLIPDHTTNGVLRTYEVTAFQLNSNGHNVQQLTPPDALTA